LIKETITLNPVLLTNIGYYNIIEPSRARYPSLGMPTLALIFLSKNCNLIPILILRDMMIDSVDSGLKNLLDLSVKLVQINRHTVYDLA